MRKLPIEFFTEGRNLHARKLYRPNEVFTPVCHSIPRAGCLPHCMLGCTHPRQTPPSILWGTVNTQPVHILLECILVYSSFANGNTSGGARISLKWEHQPSGRCQHMILPKFPKTAWNWKNLDPRGCTRPLRSATDQFDPYFSIPNKHNY